MSTYVAYYWKSLDGIPKPCVRYISRGFACKSEELPNEMKIRCGSIGIPEWDWVSCESAANVLIESAISRGLYHEKSK